MNISLQNVDKVSAVLTVQIEKADYQEKVEKSLKTLRQTSSRELFALSKAAASLTLGVPMCFMTVLLGWGTSISASSSAV